jgi:excisionase family DNA binding protein
MDLDEAAQLLGVNKATLQRAIKAGELEAVKLGYGYKVTEKALRNWVASKTVNAQEQGA